LYAVLYRVDTKSLHCDDNIKAVEE